MTLRATRRYGRGVLFPLGLGLLDRDFADNPTAFFSPEFLINPERGWRVCWHPEHGEPNPDPTWWMQEGVLVKLDLPPRVWRLTGRTDYTTGYLEGVWPD